MTRIRICTQRPYQLSAAIGALILGCAPLYAGGIERSNQSIAPIFESGRYLELGFGHVNPSVSGHDLPPAPGNRATGGVANSYSTYSLAYKQDFTPQISGTIIIDTPFGADTHYPAGQSLMFGNTRAKVHTAALTGILRWHDDNGFGVHGGVRMLRSDAKVDLSGAAYGPVGAGAGYSARFDRDTAWGWLLGISYEIPEIAGRVSLTFNSAVKHDFHTTESGPLIDPDGPDPLPPMPLLNGISETQVSTPRSWNLEFQSGVAEDTLLFGSIRWVKWSEFRVDPDRLMAVTGQGLVDLEDTTTFTLGLGRKFSDQWSGSASLTYEKRGKDLVSPLAPVSGRKGITLAAIYTRDNMKITTGVNYTWLGDAKAKTGTPPAARAKMEDNNALGVGMRVGFSF